MREAMTGPVRLVISDVDGTLVRHDKSLTEATVAAFARLRAAGIPATLISARPPAGLDWLADRLDIDLAMGAFNGGTLFTREGVVGTPHRLPAETVRAILKMGAVTGVDIWVFADGHWYARDEDNAHVPREKLSSGLMPTLVSDFATVSAADKIAFVCDDADTLHQLETKAHAAFGATIMVAMSQAYFLDFTAPEANKGDGVAALAARIGVPLSQVAVIGDMANDLPMFARAGFSIAMGQSSDAVKAAADAVTASNEDDGVAQAIDTLILPRVPA